MAGTREAVVTLLASEAVVASPGVPVGVAIGTGGVSRPIAVPGESAGFVTAAAAEVTGPVVIETVVPGLIVTRSIVPWPGEPVIVPGAVVPGAVRAGGAGALLTALGSLVFAPGLATATFEAGTGGHVYISSGASIPRIASPFASVCRVAATRARRADRVGSPDWRTGQA